MNRKTFVRIGLSGALALLALGALGITALVLTEWTPPADETYRVIGGTAGPLGSTVKLLTWNVGYAAMDRETDFFMDGGKLSQGLDSPCSLVRRRHTWWRAPVPPA